MAPFQRATLLLVFGALWLGLTALKNEPRVAFLKPLPRVVSSRDEVSFKIRVEPDMANRLLIAAAIDEGGEVVRRSDEQLDGALAPRTRWVRWSSLPAGDLLVIAEVWDGQKPLSKARTPLCVTAPFQGLCASLVAEP